MMKVFDKQPIKTKLIAIIMTATISGLMLASIALILYDRLSTKQRMIQELYVLSQVIADRSTAALLFNDKRLALKNLKALSAQENVVAACIYNNVNEIFATNFYKNSKNELCPKEISMDGYSIQDANIYLFQPIEIDNERIGTIFVKSGLDELTSRLIQYLIVVLITIVAVSIFVYGLSIQLQKSISYPVTHLTNVAKTIAEKQIYSERVNKVSDDEIGILVDAFNNMLEKIELRQNERDVAEKELRLHREHLEELVKQRTEKINEQAMIIDQIHDSVVTTDLNGKITGWNRGAERLFQYGSEEILGQHISKVYPEEEHKFLEDSVIIPLKDKGELEIEVRMRKKDRENFFAHLSLSMLYDDNKKPISMVGYTMDITDRKKAEQLLNSRTTDLAMLNKELESFSYSVSHDLRSPLRSINGFSQALIEDYYDILPKDAQDYLTRVRNSTIRMGQLIDDLLELSRVSRSEIHKDYVDMSKLALEIIDNLKDSAPERDVLIIIEPELVAYGDKGLIFIVLHNLFGNAWKYSLKQTAAKIEFGKKLDQNKSVYFIRDNGVGFDMEFSDKVFAPFQRLHANTEFEGTGVGLATVQRIITRHGGKIWFDSKPNEGTTFYFDFIK